jgi:hypothetical protein
MTEFIWLEGWDAVMVCSELSTIRLHKPFNDERLIQVTFKDSQVNVR